LTKPIAWLDVPEVRNIKTRYEFGHDIEICHDRDKCSLTGHSESRNFEGRLGFLNKCVCIAQVFISDFSHPKKSADQRNSKP
jgi:hypothetical protein